MKKDKIKTKKTAGLLVIIVFSFLFSGCSTVYSILYGSTILYYYDFTNEKNKSVTGDRYRYYLDMAENMQRFSFGFSIEGYPYRKRNDIIGGRYGLGIGLSWDTNLIKNVIFNKVMIYMETDEYSMVERIKSVLLLNNRGDIFLIFAYSRSFC